MFPLFGKKILTLMTNPQQHACSSSRAQILGAGSKKLPTLWQVAIPPINSYSSKWTHH